MEFNFDPDLLDDLSFLDETTTSSDQSFLNNYPPWFYGDKYGNINVSAVPMPTNNKRKSPTKKKETNTDRSRAPSKKAKKNKKKRRTEIVETESEGERYIMEDQCSVKEEETKPPTDALPQDENEWNYRDSSVGTKVLRYFPVNGEMASFVGQVIAFSPASSPSARDQLFKIQYPEDSDVEDLDQSEYEAARHLMMATYSSA